jgi:hypothetical protein
VLADSLKLQVHLKSRLCLESHRLGIPLLTGQLLHIHGQVCRGAFGRHLEKHLNNPAAVVGSVGNHVEQNRTARHHSRLSTHDANLTALLTEPRLFQTGSIPLPASRFICEHLHQNVFFWACTSRIHAQVPVITTGKLAETLRRQIPCGIDVAVMAGPASRARPLSLIEPQLIEDVLAFRALLARGIPAIHRHQDLAIPTALIIELAAHLAERGVVERAA